MPNSEKVMRGGAEVKFEPLQNKAAIAFFKRKIPGLTRAWDDWIAPVHSHSFTIAGGMSIDFLTDMQGAIAKALETGTGYREFLADFDHIVAKHGWSYKGSRGWRSRVIFNTNMRSARMAARWKMFQQNKDVAPFLEYLHGNSKHPRKEHLLWDHTVLPIDDSFWDTHYPKNGWGCTCDVVAHSAMSLKRKGKSVTPAPEIKRSDRIVNGKTYYNVPEGLDVGWDNNVGQAWLAPEVALGKKLASLPPQIATAAYKKQVNDEFIDAVSNSFSRFYDESQAAIKAQKILKKAPALEPQFVGYVPVEVQEFLATKGAPLENLAIVSPYNRGYHLTGLGRDKEHTALAASEVFRSLPRFLHQYQVILYDTSDGSLIYVAKQLAENGRRIKIVVKPNYQHTQNRLTSTINQTSSMSLANEWNLKESHLVPISGGW